MAHRIDPRHIAHLDSPLRRLILPPKPLLTRLGLREGDSLLDIGAGSGAFSFPAAELVGPGGKVYALDIEPIAIALLEERRAALGAANVAVLQSSEDSLGLPDGSASMALLFMVFHEVEDKKGLLLMIKRVLRPGGRIVIAEFRKKAFVPGPPPSERLGENEAQELLAEAGFVGARTERLNFALYAAFAHI